jgi:hypothetical protein
MKTITVASVLTFIALVCMVEEANAYLYCELKGGSYKKDWACKECSPSAICGVKEDCQSKNAKRGRELSDFKLSGSASSIQAQIEPPIFLAFPNHLMT